MYTAIFMVTLGAILLVCSIISLLLVIFIKNLKYCKYILFTYFTLTLLASILCATTGCNELKGISLSLSHQPYTVIRALTDFLFGFAFTLFIYNIPSVILLVAYSLKGNKQIAYTKLCPYCNQEVNIYSIRCKNCSEFLEEE